MGQGGDMTGQRTSFRLARSIAGAIFAGTGGFILFQNLAGIVASWRDILAGNGSEGLGEPLAAILVILQAYATNHQRFLQGILQQLLVASWPLLLVMVGAILSGESFTNDV